MPQGESSNVNGYVLFYPFVYMSSVCCTKKRDVFVHSLNMDLRYGSAAYKRIIWSGHLGISLRVHCNFNVQCCSSFITMSNVLNVYGVTDRLLLFTALNSTPLKSFNWRRIKKLYISMRSVDKQRWAMHIFLFLFYLWGTPNRQSSITENINKHKTN